MSRAVVIWHYFGLASGWPFLPLGIMRGLRVEDSGHRPGDKSSAESSGRRSRRRESLTRREFIGAAAALAPPLFTVGLTGVALAQLNQFPRAALYAFDSGAAPGAGRNDHRPRERHPRGRATRSARVLREMVNTTNALRADLVLLTGDLINYRLGGSRRGNCPGESDGGALRPVDDRRQP